MSVPTTSTRDASIASSKIASAELRFAGEDRKFRRLPWPSSAIRVSCRARSAWKGSCLPAATSAAARELRLQTTALRVCTTAATGCWISSAGCETGLHWDAFGPHNFHFLVSGEKEVFVAAPDQSEALYCGGGPRYLTRFVGVVDPMRPVDLERFPKYAECRGLRATLRAGDVLYLPAFWWHALVHTGAHNVSLTRWWVEPPSRRPMRRGRGASR